MAGNEVRISVVGDDKFTPVLQSADKKARGFGAGLGTAFTAGGAVAVTAVAGIGAALVGIQGDIKNATNTFQTQLGVSADEARELGDVAKNVYKNNFGGSVQDAAGVISQSFQQMGDVGAAELQAISEDALRLKDAFGVETSESIDAAKTLMENFGLSSEEAFDLIASGFQKGLNRSDDFLDTIGEYSTQFKEGGATAGEFFSLLDSGMQGGMLGTDKAADAFKEFRVRILDGSKATTESLAKLGINAETFTKKVASGEITTAEAFDIVQEKLRETDDAQVRLQAGVGLLGTQYEDLGDEAALAMDMQSGGFDDVSQATESLDAQYDTLGNTLEGFKRQALLAIAPFAEQVGAALPLVGSLGMALSGLGPIAAGIGPAVAGMASAALPALQAMGAALLMPPLGIVIALAAVGVAAYVFRDEIMAALGAAAEFVTGAATKVRDVLVGGFNTVLEFVRARWPEIATLISGPFFPIVALATDAFGIRSALEGAFSGIMGFISGLAGKAFGVGKQWADALFNGIKSGLNGIIDGFNSLIGGWNGLEFRFGGVKDPVLGQTVIPGFSVGTPDLPLIPRLASGLDFVPRDNFPAFLHRGEAVLTADENRARQRGGGDINVNVYGPMTVQSDRGGDNPDEALRDLGYMMHLEMLRRGMRLAG